MKIQLPPSLFQGGSRAAGELVRFLEGLDLGQLLEARVLKTLTPEHALVRVGSRTVLCRHTGDASFGGSFRVEVVSPWPEPVLRSPDFGWELEPLVKKGLTETQSERPRATEPGGKPPGRAAREHAAGSRGRAGLRITAKAGENLAELKSFLRGLRPGDVLPAELLEARGPGRALLRLAHRTLDARCPETIKPGVPFRVRVVEKGPDLVLKILAEEEVVEPLVQKSLFKAAGRLAVDAPRRAAGLVRFLKGLTKGQVVEAEVVETEGAEHAVMKMGEHTVAARVASPVGPGAVVRLRVARTWPEVLFKMLNLGRTGERALRDRALETLGKVADEEAEVLVMRAAKELSALEHSPDPGARETHRVLKGLALRPGSWDVKGYLEKSGLIFENRLATLAEGPEGAHKPLFDLKAALIRGLDFLKDAGEPSRATVELLRLLEGCQALSLVSRGGETQLLVPLLLWGFDRGEWGDMSLMEEGAEKRAGRRGWSVTLRLKLNRLGRVHINMVLKGKGVNVTVKTGEPESLSRLEEGFHLLRERLLSGGFESVDIKPGQMSEDAGWTRLSLRVPDVILDMHA